MRSHEARANIEWADQQATLMKEERKAEAQDFLFNGIASGRGGETLIEFINKYAGDFGGLGKFPQGCR